MIMAIWNFLTVHVDWRAYLIALGFAVVALAILSKVYGFNLPAPVLGALLGAGALLVMIAKSTQKGYDLRKTDEDTATKKATDDFDKIHAKNEALPDAQLDQKNDPWLKP